MPHHPSPRRRLALAALASLAVPLLQACALTSPRRDDIVDAASGRALTSAQLLAQARAADWVLLGEQHDNLHHHAQRGAFIAALGPGTVVVTEHLQRGRRVEPGRELQSRLQAAGFDPRAWGWPLHRALYEAVLDAGLPVLGGNAPVALVRQVAREGLAAAPPELRALLDAAPLSAAAQASLDRALEEGHCGHLAAARLPATRAAQRVRDAALALALQAAGGRPGVLVAGNEHVRRDYGVPVLLRHLRPQARLLVVAFGEPGWRADAGAHTHLWRTPGVARVDPCAAFGGAPAGAEATARRARPRNSA